MINYASMFNSNHSLISLRFRDNDDVNFSRSRPFWPLPMVIGWCWQVSLASSTSTGLTVCVI